MRTFLRSKTGLRAPNLGVALTLFIAFCVISTRAFAAVPSPIPLSNVPLVLSKSAQPQVLIAITNSQSMDGETLGAIMTGASGCYTPTGGFTPPLGAGSCPSGEAPYTVTSGAMKRDDSESRLNVAKGAITQILNDYQGSMEFGLMDYRVQSGTPTVDDTWVYYMSGAGGFSFTNSPYGNPTTTTTAGPNTYPNPCFGLSGNSDCRALDSKFPGAISDQYLVASISSDAADINDVLYINPSYGYPQIFSTFNGPWGAYAPDPYLPKYLANYNNGQVFTGYCGIEISGNFYDQGSGCPKGSSNVNQFYFGTTPTNAGYVPTSPWVLNALRGFGYNATNQLGSGGAAGNMVENVDVYSATHYSNLNTALAPETNSGSTGEIKAIAVQSPIAGLLLSADQYYTGSSAPTSSNSCSPLRYVVLITDGLPTEDLDGKQWPPIGLQVADSAHYDLTATFHADGSLASTNDQALQDTINALLALHKNGIDTYVIGLGAGVDPSANPMAPQVLKAMAVAGNTTNYFGANSSQSLSADLHVVVGMIQAAALSTSSAAVNSTALRTGSVAYQSRFTPSTAPWGDWTGDLLAFPIAWNGSVNTSPSAATWSAQQNLDTQNWDTGRVIVTWNPQTGQGTPFRWADLSVTQQADLLTSPTDTLGPSRLDYLRGSTASEMRNGGTFRNRSHILGDIIDSAPLWVGPPADPYQDPSYLAFQSANASRAPIVYVGANDGMLHAFDAATGAERFAFIPNAVFPDLMALTNPAYNRGHLFYVDGSPVAGDVQFSDTTWHTVLAGGLNDGGNAVYALDVTDPGAWASASSAATHILWEFTDPYLGMTYGKPAIARIPWGGSGGTRFVVIFGSGYNNVDQNPYIFVVDAQTGALIDRIDLCAGQPSSVCDPTADNGVSGVSLVYPGTDGVAQYLYAGDLQGNLWKVDLSSGAVSSWTATPIFKALDASGVPQPITTRPAVSLHPLYPAKSGYMVYFGTGRLLGQPDLTTTQPQTFYGIWDNGVTPPPTRSSLVSQTITTVTLGSPTPSGISSVRMLTQNPIDWNSKRGWYVDLPATGERVINNPRLVDGNVIFTTYAPTPGSCSGGGNSWLMVLDYANGGGMTRPQLDLNGDSKLDANDLVGGQAPSGISLGPQFATAPTIISTHNGNVGDVKLISESSGKIQSVSDAVSQLQGQWSWKQLQ